MSDDNTSSHPHGNKLSNASTAPTVIEKEHKERNPFDEVTNVNTVSTLDETAPEYHPVELAGVEQLDEMNGYEYTAYNFSPAKKWWILTVVALCQTSMNFVSWPSILYKLTG